MRAKARAYDKTARGSALMLLLVGSVFSGTGYWVLQERAGYPDEWFVPWILFGVGGLCFFGFIAQIIGGSRKRV